MKFMQSVETIWLANVLSTGVIVTVVAWFLKRLFKDYDDRIAKSEKEAAEIKKNYIQRFEDVKQNQQRNKDEILGKLEEVKVDKIEYRMKQIHDMTEIKHSITDLRKDMERNGKI